MEFKVPEKVSLLHPSRFMDTHPDARAAGPHLVLPNGELDRACRWSSSSPEVAFHRLADLGFLLPRSRRLGCNNLSDLDPANATGIESVVEAFMRGLGQVVELAGLLDEVFFMYGDDTSLGVEIGADGPHLSRGPL